MHHFYRNYPTNGLFVLAIKLCLILMMFSMSSFAQSTNQGVVLSDRGIVIDPATQAVFVMNPKNGISALNAGNGQVLWQSKEADRPIGLSGNLLIAMKDHPIPDSILRVVVLDISNGKTVLSHDAALPAEVKVAIDQGLGQSFSVNAVINADDVNLIWSYQKQTVQGAFLEGGQLPKTDLEGAIRFNLRQRGFATIAIEDAPALPKTPSINLQANERLGSVQSRQFASLDRETVLASKRLQNRVWNQYEWSFYDRQGNVLGQIEYHASRSDFMILNQRQLVYVSLPYELRQGDQLLEHPLSVRGVDLTTGEQLWEFAVRDTQYKGPYPS